LAPAAAALCACLAAGCSYQLSSLIPKSGGEADETGAIGRPAAYAEADASPPEIDLAYARAAAAEALARGGKDASVPWENPHTGAGGNITPLATFHSEGSFTCRDFLASYLHGDAQAWLQGEACRTNHGEWEVKSLVPLKRN
jgi:surface antigen